MVTATKLVDFARPWLRPGKRAGERLAHPIRRHRALLLVERLQPTRILIVCYGNICRSPYGAAVLKRALNGDARIEVLSAGLFGPDRPSPELAIAAAARRGIDLASHRSRLVTVGLLDNVELLLVMDTAHRYRLRAEFGVDPRRIVLIGDLDPAKIRSRTIPDPYGQAPDVFDDCYQRIERCVGQLASRLSRPVSPAASHKAVARSTP